jgi:uncharacterized protein
MADLDRLDGYLSSDESPEECLMLSDLDGFLHGVACSPVAIPVGEWMGTALGGSAVGAPAWVLDEIGSRYAEIVEGLLTEPPVVGPIFWKARGGHVIAMDWCEGFMHAVSLRPREWLRLTESGTSGGLITPILVHLLDDDGNSVLGVPQEDLEETLDLAADTIADTVSAIFRFWRKQ